MALTPEEEQRLADLKRQRAQLLGTPELLGETAGAPVAQPFPPGQVGAFAGGPAAPRSAGGIDLPVGALIGGTVGAGVGGIPGAALGAAGGEAVGQLVSRALGREDVPQTSGEAAKRIATEGLLGLGGEVAGRGILRGAQAVGRGLAPTLRPGAKEVARAVQPAFPDIGFKPISKALGATKQPALLPAQLTESPIIDTIQEVSKSSFLGGGRIVKAQQLTDDIVSGLVDDFAKGLTGPTGRVETGELIFDALEEGIDAFSATGRGLYSTVDDLTGAAVVDFKPVKAAATKLLSQAKKGIRTKEQTTVLQGILERPDTLPFSDAHLLRSDLLGISRSGTELVKGRAQGTARALSNEVDRAMGVAAKDISGEALEAWRAANKFWRTGKQTFNSRFIRGLANADPEVVLDRVLQSGKTSNIIKLRKTINNPEIWRKVQGQFVNKALNKSVTDEVSLNLSGKALLKNMRGFGNETLNALAPKGELKQLEKFATALALNQAKQPGGKGATVLIAMAQAGAAAKILFTGEADAASAAILIGPLALSRALTNPATSRILLEGFKVGGKTKAITSFAARLAAVLAKQGIEHDVQIDGQSIGTQPRQAPNILSTLVGAQPAPGISERLKFLEGQQGQQKPNRLVQGLQNVREIKP